MNLDDILKLPVVIKAKYEMSNKVINEIEIPDSQ